MNPSTFKTYPGRLPWGQTNQPNRVKAGGEALEHYVFCHTDQVDAYSRLLHVNSD